MNAAVYGEKRDYDRYLGNTSDCLVVNWVAYPFYIAAVAWPGAIWLPLATMFFGFPCDRSRHPDEYPQEGLVQPRPCHRRAVASADRHLLRLVRQ
jgi:hypothetical protein